MKAIMISIQPQWVEKILNGEKTIEIRKTRPKCELPCKVYIYCTMPKKQEIRKPHSWKTVWLKRVVAEFTLNEVEDYLDGENFVIIGDRKSACLTFDEIMNYANGKPLYAWYIDNLKIYDRLKELNEFYKSNYKKIIDELEFNGCDEKHCKFAVGNSFLGDDGYCDYSNCPKLKLQRPPQSWCYVQEL